MPSLKKQYPHSDGWIHSKLTLKKGHTATPESLAKGFRSMGAEEVPYCKIQGQKAVVIFREKPNPEDS
jgi:hypothetical protein